MTTARERDEEHMERVRAVHRRSAWERVLTKIMDYELWERSIASGQRIGRHEPDDPPLSDHDKDQLKYLRELREVIRQEMIDHGQIPA